MILTILFSGVTESSSSDDPSPHIKSATVSIPFLFIGFAAGKEGQASVVALSLFAVLLSGKLSC